MKLSIIIPVYNEKSTIEALLEKVAAVRIPDWEKEVIIVDDCSIDGTRDLLGNYKGIHKIIFHEKNRGKGVAIRSGIEAITGDYVVIQDADLEYDPQDFFGMVQKMQSENLEVLYGSRRLKKDNVQHAGLAYYVGGVVLSGLTNLLYSQRITDEPTCYKMFATTFLRSLPLQGERFEFCPEVTALTGLKGIKIKEVPISYFPRPRNEGKKINALDGVQAVLVLLWYRLNLQKFIHLTKLNAMIMFLKRNKLAVILALLALVNLIIFSQLYGFHPNNDTDSFIFTIERFRGLDAPLHPNRYMNPLYALVGASFFRWATPAMSIIISNIIFYFGIVLLTYGLIRRVFRSDKIGFVTALTIIPAYALIRYGLTQVQDIGGYFWFILTVYAGWRWWEEKRDGWLYLGGLSVGLGMLTKESGAMGALFVGILFLAWKTSWKERITAFIKFSIIPFLFLIGNQFNGRRIHYSSLDWVVWNWKTFFYEYTPFKWLSINLSTFNATWLGAALGLGFLVKRWKTIDSNIKLYFLAIIPGSLSYFGWPIFISRTVFICSWLIVPLAAYGLVQLYEQGSWKKYLSILLLVLMIISPYVLQSTLRYVHIFAIIDSCHKNFACTWHYFWSNRENFSTIQ